MAKAALTEKPKTPAVFARHETFHPRFGWLKKGYDLALADPGIFLREDAPVLLGVGKNMVRSIRYWCSAFKVLTEEDGQIGPTRLGQQLLDDDGWDPFLENPASLWLLHWNLLKAPCTATAWAYAFGEFQAAEFTPEHLVDELRDYANGLSSSIADSSLRKDVSCILRMYADQESKKGPTEDSIDCPFTALRLLYSVGDGRRYEFQVGPKETLPAEIVVAACLEFAGISENESSAMGVSRLAHLVGSPGRVFKLSEAAIAEAIEQVARRREDLFISDSAGLLQLQYEGDPLAMSEAILNKYFAG
ncbi:MAG: DUF4007 family protein [Leptolyngbya sp.]|nr:DUF4007 family protein [Leptolyngbya sp.]